MSNLSTCVHECIDLLKQQIEHITRLKVKLEILIDRYNYIRREVEYLREHYREIMTFLIIMGDIRTMIAATNAFSILYSRKMRHVRALEANCLQRIDQYETSLKLLKNLEEDCRTKCPHC
jgi:hypothetical protein